VKLLARCLRSLLAALLLAAAVQPMLAASRPEESLAENDTMQGIRSAIGGRDCERAVARLNRGLAERYPGVYLLAGALYEQGVCLKPNWARAEQMYLRAHESGHPGGLLRLLSGLAEGGRDPAAAVWWSQQAPGLPVPTDCRVAERLWRDADLFVATLKLWPAQRLSACVYTVGVLAAITGEMEYPQDAARLAMRGEVSMRFTPATGDVKVTTTDLELAPMAGVNDSGALMDRDSRSARKTFERHAQSVAERALRRHPRPDAVPAEWGADLNFRFDFQWK
jgi:hypothetical protein